jgi:hypothetical protein
MRPRWPHVATLTTCGEPHDRINTHGTCFATNATLTRHCRRLQSTSRSHADRSQVRISHAKPKPGKRVVERGNVPGQSSNIFRIIRQHVLQLQILAMRREFQRQGAATALWCRRVEVSRRTGFSIFVFTSSIGRALYSHLGFQWCGSVRRRTPGDDDEIGCRQ